MFYLTPPRHISTLPTTVFEVLKYDFRITLENGLNSDIAACPKRAKGGHTESPARRKHSYGNDAKKVLRRRFLAFDWLSLPAIC